MTYRFSVVASGYHKGRLLFVWEPNIPPGDSFAEPPETNVTYSKIVDIAKERDFSITIGWGSNSPGLILQKPIQSDSNDMYSTGTPILPNTALDNGVLTCYVLNTLVTTGDNSEDITIMVQAHSDDLDLWGPNQDALQGLTMKPQAAPALFEAQAGQVGDSEPNMEENAAEATVDLGAVGGSPNPKTTGIFLHGDPVKSFRTLLKRYCLRRSVVLDITVAEDQLAVADFSGNGYAYMPDESYAALDGGVFNGPFTIHSLIYFCFAGWRGSTRFKLLPMVYAGGAAANASLTVRRGNNNTLSDPTVVYYARSPLGVNQIDARYDFSVNGAQVSNKASGHVTDFELPYYATDRFAPTVTGAVTNELGYGATATFATNATTQNYFIILKEYGAVGEDYNLFFFTGVPPLWYKPLSQPVSQLRPLVDPVS